jgi:hypothetical protein
MTTSADRPRFLRSAGIPPALRAALGEVLDHFDDDLLLDDEPSEWLLAQMEFVFDRGEPVWARAPELADLGTALLDRRQHPEIRRWGCIWLTQFPTPENVEALAKVALDPGEPKRLRSQAAWSLGFRQLQGRHPSLRWTPEALAMADRALLALVEGTADRIELEELPLALRHVDHPGVLNALARRALFWAEALEAFATPALAAAIVDQLADAPDRDALRLLRLAAATLGPDVAPRLTELAASAPLDTKLELLFAALALTGEAAMGDLERALSGLKYTDLLRARARWHLANPGVLPTVRGLATARRTALLPQAERRPACAAAAEDLHALTPFARHPEAYLYSMWAWMVVGAGEPERARPLVEAHPDSTRRVLPLLLEALAARGRVGPLLQAAQQHDALGRGAWALATHGRPFAALALCDLSRDNDTHVAAARALACFLAGRPDLTRRLLEHDPPRVEVLVDSWSGRGDPALQALPGFPGTDEAWWLAHEPEARPELVAWQGGVDGLVAACRGEPAQGAEPDRVDLGVFAGIERRVKRELAGATVCLVGEFEDRAGTEERLASRGARLVDGPFAGVDFYCFELAPCSVIAKLERLGARLYNHYELAPRKEAP